MILQADESWAAQRSPADSACFDLLKKKTENEEERREHERSGLSDTAQS